MITRRPLQAVLIVAALLAISATAFAASIEIKVRTMLREKPTSSARILDRLAAGKKLPMLGQTDDGNWVHVRSGTHEGWIQAAAVKGLRGKDEDAGEEAAADDEEPARPLAKKRGVRPEAWVSKSRYHESEDTKLIISVNKAELFGRPSATGAVLGILRRGEQVQLVKKSVDKKWINVDIGGGETAWIEAKAVKPGKVATSTPSPDESEEQEAAPPPTITPEGAKKKAKMTKVAEAPPPEEKAEEEAPPPPPKKTKKQAKVETPPPEEEAPPPKKSRGDTEDETPPGLAPSTPKKSKKAAPKKRGWPRRRPRATRTPRRERPRRRARSAARRWLRAPKRSRRRSRRPRSSRTSGRRAARSTSSPACAPASRSSSQRFTSNGTGTLANYEGSTNAFGAQLGLGVSGAIGKYFLVGGDASYTFAGAAALRYISPVDGSAVVLGVQAHTIDGGLSAGLHFGVLGGFSVRLRLGGQMMLNLIQPSVAAKLPSDRIVGMTIALGLSAPTLFTLGGAPVRHLGVRRRPGAGAARADGRARGRRAVDHVRRLLRRRAVVHGDAAERREVQGTARHRGRLRVRVRGHALHRAVATQQHDHARRPRHGAAPDLARLAFYY